MTRLTPKDVIAKYGKIAAHVIVTPLNKDGEPKSYRKVEFYAESH